VRAPTDDDLRGLLESEADRFRQPAMLTFRHVYLDPSRRGEAAARAEAARLLRPLQGADAATVAEEAGDRFLLGYEFRDLSAPQVARSFGESFAAALEAAPLDRWTGPVASAYGLHLVLVEARVEAQLPPIEVVAPLLRAEVADRQRREAIDSFLRALLSRYTVTVEDPAQAAAPRP
jgi:peptidyl-prolyl cis-trans isomerase C